MANSIPKKAVKAGKVSLSEDERREKIRQGLLLKKECDSKALAVVEKLLDPTDREWFRSSAFYLNGSYYDDVVEERNCIVVCGYPLCNNQLKKSNQKYHISLKQNKVFDITERKKFCSNECFKSSEFYKDQLLSSPLWLREPSDQKPVVFYDEINKNELKDFKSPGGGKEVDFFKTVATEDTDKSGEEDKKAVAVADTSEDSEMATKMTQLNLDSTSAPVVNEAYKPSRKRPVKSRASTDFRDGLTRVEKCLGEWFTIDTYRLVRGDAYVRRVLVENKCTVENVLAAVGATGSDDHSNNPTPQQTFDFRSKYIQLCRNLDLREMEDDEQDRQALGTGGPSGPGGRKSRRSDDADDPYEQLRLEAQIERLKINSFLQGRTEYDHMQMQDGKEGGKGESGGDIRERETVPEPRIPLVDKYAQGALRRRIVHDQLDRVLPDILQLMGILRGDINEILGKFVFSFDLSAENVVLKPEEWTLVAIFLLKMIAAQDERTRTCLNLPSSLKYLNMMLLSYDVKNTESLDEKIDGFHANIHLLLSKMKKPLS